MIATNVRNAGTAEKASVECQGPVNSHGIAAFPVDEGAGTEFVSGVYTATQSAATLIAGVAGKKIRIHEIGFEKDTAAIDLTVDTSGGTIALKHFTGVTVMRDAVRPNAVGGVGLPWRITSTIAAGNLFVWVRYSYIV